MAYGFPERVIAIYNDFLSNRKAVVQVGEIKLTYSHYSFDLIIIFGLFVKAKLALVKKGNQGL